MATKISFLNRLNQNKMYETKALLIDSEKSKKWLLEAVSKETKQLDFCSAFITTGSLKFFYESFSNNGFSGYVRLLVRWQLMDLLNGASDLESYKFARDKGLRFFINQDFHGKVYRINPGGVLIGSANLTSAGFALKENKNDEVCVVVQESQDNNNFVDNLFSNATEIDDEKFNIIKEVFETFKNKNIKETNPYWPHEVMEFLQKEQAINGLIVDEMLHLKYSEISAEKTTSLSFIHDMSLLGVSSNEILDKSIVKSKFLKTKSFLWLTQKLNNGPGYFYFGELTAMLHDDIIDDPVPYRKDVKELLQNLLDWTDEFAKDYVIIDRPNYSQRVTKVI
jgi:hypothetical protein